jgi:hypothetical protein
MLLANSQSQYFNRRRRCCSTDTAPRKFTDFAPTCVDDGSSKAFAFYCLLGGIRTLPHTPPYNSNFQFPFQDSSIVEFLIQEQLASATATAVRARNPPPWLAMWLAVSL